MVAINYRSEYGRQSASSGYCEGNLNMYLTWFYIVSYRLCILMLSIIWFKKKQKSVKFP